MFESSSTTYPTNSYTISLAPFAEDATKASVNILEIVVQILSSSEPFQYTTVKCWLYVFCASLYLLKASYKLHFNAIMLIFLGHSQDGAGRQPFYGPHYKGHRWYQAKRSWRHSHVSALRRSAGDSCQGGPADIIISHSSEQGNGCWQPYKSGPGQNSAIGPLQIRTWEGLDIWPEFLGNIARYGGIEYRA